MNQVKNVAVIGGGHWGKNLVRNFHALGVLHTLCDTREDLLDRYKEQYPDLQLTCSSTQVFNNPAITRVVIAAPAIHHYKLAKEALEAGKDVYVEKPICMDRDHGQELIDLAEKRGRILMVGHLLQYHPCVIKIQELLAHGELGKLQYIVSNRLNLGAIRTEENALWNFAPHDVSVILSLCANQLPTKVRCTGGAYLSHGIADTTLTTLSFSGGVRAHIYVSWLNPFKEQKLTIIGSDGLLVFDDQQPWDKKLMLYRNHVVWREGAIPIANKSEGEPVTIPESEPLRAECEHFLHCCEERIHPRTDGREGLRVLDVLHAAQVSLNSDGEAISPGDFASHTSPYFAHPTAVIDQPCAIGPGTKIWHFSHIMAHAIIGKNCNLGQNVLVSNDVVLGQNVKVQNNVSIYAGVTCEDDVFLGPSMVFTNILNPRSEISRRGKYQNTLLRKGVTVGANATILCGHEIGTYAFIGAGAVVTKDVKPYALMAGNPARQIGWMSRTGERLDLPLTGDGLEAICPATGEVYVLEGEILHMKRENIEKELHQNLVSC